MHARPYFYCSVPEGDEGRRTFPYRGDHACYMSPQMSAVALGRPLEDGVSLTEADCAAVTADGRECRWSDGSRFTRSPPAVHTTCPRAPAPASVFCGGPCAHCEYERIGDLDGFDVPCLGRNDDRDLGVCGATPDMASGCSPDMPASALCGHVIEDAYIPEEWPESSRCVCLSFRRDGELMRAGWPVPDENCTAYRDLYPGEVECYDDDWSPLP